MLSRVVNTAMEKDGVSPKPSRSTPNNPPRSDSELECQIMEVWVKSGKTNDACIHFPHLEV